MTTLFIEDFNKICRCCLCKNGEMRPLFGSCIDNMLRFVAEIDVNAGDGLPELMCVPCVLQVSRAFTFKQQCQRSDQTLRSYLGQIGKIDSENNNFRDNFKNTGTDRSVADVKKEKTVTNHLKECDQFDAIDDTATDNLDDQLDLDSLPAEIESSSFEEDIELSNLPSSVADDDEIQQHLDGSVLSGNNEMTTVVVKDDKSASPSKYGDYFDEIKLGVGNVDEIPDQSIDGTFDDIPVVESDIEKKITTDFIDDILSTENQSIINCGVCNLHFDSKEKLILHSQTVHLTKTSESISNHNNTTIATTNNSTENGKKNAHHECPECHKVFAESKILRRHLKIHSPIKPHRCPECSMSFAESSNLSKHMKKHTGELRAVQGKPNLCSVCGKGFKWASSLSKHMKHHTRHKILTCPYCPKYYVEARSLNIHLRSHTGEKPFTCNVCNKGFTQMGNLEKHIRVHTGEKPYTCPMPFCNKSFSQSGYVAIHLRTHTGERPYRCDFENCGRAFAGSNTLAIHKRTHTGERPYHCNVPDCGKTFARQETANIHMRTHSGEKPYTCKICSRGFTSSGHLTGHIRSHNGTSKTHECKICQKRFAGSSSLKVHMKSHIEKANQQQQEQLQQQQEEEHDSLQQQQQQQQIFDDKTTIFECNMCKMNIPSSVLTSPDELQAYNHEFIDDVLICSNVASIIDDSKMIEEIHDENGTNIILTTATDIENGQQLLINLSDLK